MWKLVSQQITTYFQGLNCYKLSKARFSPNPCSQYRLTYFQTMDHENLSKNSTFSRNPNKYWARQLELVTLNIINAPHHHHSCKGVQAREVARSSPLTLSENLVSNQRWMEMTKFVHQKWIESHPLAYYMVWRLGTNIMHRFLTHVNCHVPWHVFS